MDNQVIESMNLLYLALITERVPIIPAFSPFTSSHVKSEEYVEFSEVFDLPHLEKMMKTKILEWHEVKDPYSETMEPLGCWNLEKLSSEVMVLSVPPANLNLDISYTTPPKWTKAYPDNPSDPQTKFWSLATLGFSDTQPNGLIPEVSLVGQKSLPADQQLLCFDNLLFVCAHEPWELGKMYSPVWRFVGQHMRWHERIQTIANDFIRQALGVEADARFLRRGDFREQCLDLDPSICLAPLLLYEIQVEAVKEELLAMKGIKVDHVFVTSDEEDPSWWETVYERGWKTLDHSAILTQHGPWYPVFIDAVLGSGAAGFVGTYTSTVSMLAMIRVTAWNNGVNRSVRWGHHMTQEDLKALTKQQ
ncbi:unnamed protein product [Mycena citricolor]|uniref:Uncharacterized protein n=1 Tax=Mycena citricolor TaxID=2018698 RepID=A0AAD2K1Y5_9AGAR|nr:unnamed protein product [Mycena citricolor]